MELESLDIPAINQFASKYMKQEEPVTSFFHYNINEQDVFSRRLEDLGRGNSHGKDSQHASPPIWNRFRRLQPWKNPCRN